VLAALSYMPLSALAGEDDAGRDYTDQDYMAAGIALLARHEHSELIFLVRHHSRSWYEMPGGRRKLAGDTNSGQGERSETAYETALRECYEESRGFLLPEFLRGVVDPTRKIRDGEFVYFVAKIDWFSLTELPGEPDADHESTHAFTEIVDYAWVPVTNVINSESGAVVDTNGRRLEIRRQLKSRLVQARAADWLQSK
jgi:8-oxo-dGTP pyrophosphatase MutT (NUDIX family)